MLYAKKKQTQPQLQTQGKAAYVDMSKERTKVGYHRTTTKNKNIKTAAPSLLTIPHHPSTAFFNSSRRYLVKTGPSETSYQTQQAMKTERKAEKNKQNKTRDLPPGFSIKRANTNTCGFSFFPPDSSFIFNP